MEKRTKYQEQMGMMFDDRRLIGIARTMLHSTSAKPDNVKILTNLFTKTILSVEERNVLLQFMDEFKPSLSSRRPLSIKDMKREIMSIIDFKSTNDWGTTVNREEVYAIYQFLIEHQGILEKAKKKN